MKNTKLILTLNSLSKEELRSFRYFLSCKLFNRREDPIRLFDYLKDALSRSKPIDKKTVFQKLLPNKPFNEIEFRNQMAYLSKPLNQFLAFQKLYAYQGDELIAMCHAFRERGLYKQFETTIKKATTLQQTSALQDSDFYYRNFQLEQERYYTSTQQGRTHTTNLKEVAQSLDISYFANRLRQSCYMLSHQNMYNTAYDFTIVGHVLEEVKRKNLIQIPAIGIYYYCYLAQVYPDNVSYFKSFQHLLIKNSEQFTISEMKDIYLLAINIAIKRYNQGHRDIVTDLLELYQSGIDQNILLTNNFLSRFTYKNVVVLALTQKQFEWAESFINDYSSLLEKDYQEVMRQYNLAKFYCEKKEFDAALEYLFLTDTSDDAYINIDTKILLARIYHEQDNTDAQIALSESFKKILNRKKEILGYHYNTYRNFLNCINKLTVLNPYNRSDKQALLEEIKNTKPLPDKHWFVEQLSS